MSKHTEEAIDKVLAGLRDADTPAGMEGRILETLQHRASVRPRPGWRRFRPEWLPVPVRPIAVESVAWGVALAGVFAVVLAVPAIRLLGHVLGSASAPSKRISGPVVASVPSAAPEMAGKSAHLPFQPVARSMRISKQDVNAQRAEVANESDSLAMDEMHAASHPAPPMPLTQQEKLLLRIAHKTEPIELAMLDPKLQAAEDSEERAEFQRFFERSPPAQATAAQAAAEQPAPQQSTTEQATPGQPTAPGQPIVDSATPEQQVQEQTTPEQLAPDPSTTPQPTPRQ